METKLTLPFVKKGSPFTVGNWTIEKHSKALELMAKDRGDLSPEETEAELKYYIVYVGLAEIDDSIDMETIRNLHVDNLIQLFQEIYYKGRVDIFFHQDGKKKKQ